MMDLKDIAQGSERWLQWRKDGVCASEIAAVIGKCPYSTPYQVWCDKLGIGERFKGNFATQRGTELEDLARSRYELMNMEDMPPALAIHPKYEICRASLDGINAERTRILEIKCPSLATLELAQKGELPEHYVCQTQWQLAVTGAEVNDYFVYYDKTQTSALVEVKPDVSFQGFLIAQAFAFWEKYILTKIPPSLTHKDEKIDESEEMTKLAGILIELDGDKKKPATNLRNEIKKEVIKLGGHSRVRCGRVLVVEAAGTHKLYLSRDGE